MSKYILTCCSTTDLTHEYLETRNIPYVSFHYSINDKEFKDDFGQTIPTSSFYEMMRKGAKTKTSMVNISEFIDFFEPYLKQGIDVFHLSTSSGLSGTYNSAMVAKEIMLEKYPDRKIIVIDSLAASSGYGLLLETLYQQKEKGMSIDDLAVYAEEIKLNVHHWFYSTDLSYYVRGGRISKASGFIGSVLNICPLLNMDNHGKLTPRYKVVGKKRTQVKLVEQMKEHADGGTNYDQLCFISHADCMDDALRVTALIEAAFPALKGKIQIFDVGTTIGSHTGPGTLALFFFGTRRIS